MKKKREIVIKVLEKVMTFSASTYYTMLSQSSISGSGDNTQHAFVFIDIVLDAWRE